MKNWALILFVAILFAFGMVSKNRNKVVISNPQPVATQQSLPKPQPIPTQPLSQVEIGATDPQNCPKTPLHLLVDERELSFLFRKDEIVAFKGKPNPCLRVGTQIEIWANSPVEPRYIQIWAKGITQPTLPGERARLKIQERKTALDAPLASTCEGFCDDVVALGQFPDGAEWLDLRPEDQQSLWKPPNSRSIPFEPGVSGLEVFKKIGEFKNKSFVVSGIGPHWQGRPILNLAKRLRQVGAAKVYWYRGGALEARGVPMAPPQLDGVNVIHATDIPALLHRDAILVFLGQGYSRSIALAGSRVIAPQSQIIYPIAPVSESFYDEMAQRSQFKSNWFPGPQDEIIVYGFSEYDFRVYAFVRMLVNEGHTKIHWLRGGLKEIELARKLGVISF